MNVKISFLFLKIGNKKYIQINTKVMFGFWKALGKEKINKFFFSHIWFYYEKYKRKSNIIKIIKKFKYF